MALVAYRSCDGLLTELRDAAARAVGPYGLGGLRDLSSGRLPPGAVPDSGALPAVPAPGAAEMRAQRQPDEHSTTNVHEAGADEPDLVKTDGSRIVALARGRGPARRCSASSPSTWGVTWAIRGR